MFITRKCRAEGLTSKLIAWITAQVARTIYIKIIAMLTFKKYFEIKLRGLPQPKYPWPLTSHAKSYFFLFFFCKTRSCSSAPRRNVSKGETFADPPSAAAEATREPVASDLLLQHKYGSIRCQETLRVAREKKKRVWRRKLDLESRKRGKEESLAKKIRSWESQERKRREFGEEN